MPLSKTYIKSRNSYKVTFEVPAQANPNKQDIKLLGDFNDWSWEEAPTMKKTKSTFKVAVELSAGKKYQYRFMVGQEYWYNDEIADEYVSSPFGGIDNCVVNLPTPSKNVSDSKLKITKVDFTKIEGIGPKINSLLIEAGYTSFESLSKASKADLSSVLALAGKRYQMHDPSTWAKQAKLIFGGKVKQLEKLQAELKGGRKK